MSASEIDKYKTIIENIRFNLQRCDTEENADKCTRAQMVFMLVQIYDLVKE